MDFANMQMVEFALPAIAGLLATGLLAGLLAGLLGVGGGIVIVPVLFILFGLFGVGDDIVMHMAVATSLATIIPISITSARAHHKQGAVDMAVFKLWAPFMLVGAGFAGAVSAGIDSRILQLLFGVVAVYVSATMITGRTTKADKQGTDARLADAGRGARGGAIAALIGGASALMGIGGGSIAVPVLSALRLPVHRAVGTAAAFGFIIAVPGAAGFIWAGGGVAGRPEFSLGFVNLPAAVIIFSTSLFAVPLGSRLAHSLAPGRLRRAFGFFLMLSAINILADAIF